MIPAERAHLQIDALTDPGMLREKNEDRFAVSAFQLSADDSTPSVFAIVSDGVGGHQAGEIAAELAVEKVSRRIAASSADHPVESLKNALISANADIREYARQDPLLAGMAATCVCAWVIGDRLYCASAGDSRMYMMRSNRIYQLTKDHTWIQEAIESGVLSHEQAQNHPNSHIIRRYLGSNLQINPDSEFHLGSDTGDVQLTGQGALLLDKGDILLLCTDGLTDLVSAEEILEGFLVHPHQDALKYLVDLSNQRGGHDNITLVALTYPAPPSQTSNNRQVVLTALLAVALLLAAISVCALTVLILILQRLAG